MEWLRRWGRHGRVAKAADPDARSGPDAPAKHFSTPELCSGVSECAAASRTRRGTENQARHPEPDAIARASRGNPNPPRGCEKTPFALSLSKCSPQSSTRLPWPWPGTVLNPYGWRCKRSPENVQQAARRWRHPRQPAELRAGRARSQGRRSTGRHMSYARRRKLAALRAAWISPGAPRATPESACLSLLPSVGEGARRAEEGAHDSPGPEPGNADVPVGSSVNAL